MSVHLKAHEGFSPLLRTMVALTKIKTQNSILGTVSITVKNQLFLYNSFPTETTGNGTEETTLLQIHKICPEENIGETSNYIIQKNQPPEMGFLWMKGGTRTAGHKSGVGGGMQGARERGCIVLLPGGHLDIEAGTERRPRQDASAEIKQPST